VRHAIRHQLCGLLTLFCLASFPAAANHHFMSIREVYAGSEAAPQAQYVMLQMYQANQNVMGGHHVDVFDAGGAIIDTFTFASTLDNGLNQAYVLLATAEAQAYFNITPDLVMANASIPRAGGKICFDSIDCVSWGNYTGSSTLPSPTGAPFAVEGLASGKAIRRDISRGTSAILLQSTDDSGDSRADFLYATAPLPINNAGKTGALPRLVQLTLPGPVAAKAVLAHDTASGNTTVDIRNAATGASVRSYALGTAAKPIAFVTVPDINANGADELAALLYNRVDGSHLVVLRDAGTGGTLLEFNFSSDAMPQALAVLPDESGGAQPTLALLNLRYVDRLARIESRILNTETGGLTSLDTVFAPRDFAVLPDVNGDGARDLAILGCRDTGACRIEIRDGVSRLRLGLAFLKAGDRPIEMVTLGDINADGAGDIATLISRAGGVGVEYRSGATRTVLRFKGLPSSPSVPFGLQPVNDLNADGKPELAVYSFDPVALRIRGDLRDGATGSFVRGFRYGFSTLFRAADWSVGPDISGNGLDEIDLLGKRNSDQLLRLEGRDGGDGTRSTFFDLQ